MVASWMREFAVSSAAGTLILNTNSNMPPLKIMNIKVVTESEVCRFKNVSVLVKNGHLDVIAPGGGVGSAIGSRIVAGFNSGEWKYWLEEEIGNNSEPVGPVQPATIPAELLGDVR